MAATGTLVSQGSNLSVSIATDWLTVAGVTVFKAFKIIARFCEGTETFGRRHRQGRYLDEGELRIFQVGRKDANHLDREIVGR